MGHRRRASGAELRRSDRVEFVVQGVNVERAVLGRDEFAGPEQSPVVDLSVLRVRDLDATVVGVDE